VDFPNIYRCFLAQWAKKLSWTEVARSFRTSWDNPGGGNDGSEDENTEGPNAINTPPSGDGSPDDASNYLDSYTLIDEAFRTRVTVTVGSSTRTIESNSLPNHETGEFPNDGNPNTITEQSLSYVFTTEPTFTGNATFAQTPGVAVNGVAFEPGTAESVSCGGGENYRIEALQDLYNLGLDFNNAHVQPGGQYHYHGVSSLLVEAYATDDDLVHIGFAADGYLMYFSKSGAYRSSYQLATTPRTGSDCVATGPANNTRFDLESTPPDGTYVSDWMYTEGAGDLDACNGTALNGEYLYFVTNEYPYIPRCLNGEFGGRDGQGGEGGPPDGGPPDGGPPDGGPPDGGPPGGGNDGPPQGTQPGGLPDFAAAAATLGVSEDDLRNALGAPPPDFEAAAAILGVTVEALQEALGG